MGCSGCAGPYNNSSVEWIVNRPSLLIWAPQIRMSEADYQIVSEHYYEYRDPLLQETIHSVLTGLSNEGVVSTFRPDSILSETDYSILSRQTSLVMMEKGIPASGPDKDGKQEPEYIPTSAGPVCGAIAEGIYCSLFISSLLGGTCFFDRYEATYVKEIITSGVPSADGSLGVFEEYCEYLVPLIDPREDYQIFCPKEIRERCPRGEECARDVGRHSRAFLDRVLFLRENQDIRSLAKSVDRAAESNDEDAERTRAAINRDIARAQKKVYSAFLDVTEWASFAGIAASACTAASSVVYPQATVPLAAATAVAEVAERVAKKVASRRNSWKLAVAKGISSKYCRAYPFKENL